MNIKEPGLLVLNYKMFDKISMAYKIYFGKNDLLYRMFLTMYQYCECFLPDNALLV